MANLVTFAKKLWKDKVGGNTPITAAELNRMEGGINDCATQINKLGDSVSQLKPIRVEVAGTTNESGCLKAEGVPIGAVVLYVDISTGSKDGVYNIGLPYRYNLSGEIGIAVCSEKDGAGRVKNQEIAASVYYVR